MKPGDSLSITRYDNGWGVELMTKWVSKEDRGPGYKEGREYDMVFSTVEGAIECAVEEMKKDD